MRRRWIIAVLALPLLWGCTMRKPLPQHRAVVSRICVQRADTKVFCAEPQTLRQVLNALRQPGQLLLTKDDPDTLSLPELRLTLLLTDNTQRHYIFKGDRYIKNGDSPWKEADPAHIAPLLTLLTDLTTARGTRSRHP